MLNLGADFYKANRTKLLKSSKAKLIILSGNGTIQSSLDQHYPFKQESNFYYLTGLVEPDLILVINNKKEYLILPKKSKYQSTFDFSMSEAEIKKKSLIENIYSEQEGIKLLKKDILKNKKVHTIMPNEKELEIYGITALPFRRKLINLIKKINKDIKILDLAENLAELRMIKSPKEVAVIKKSVQITKEAIDYVLAPELLAGFSTTNDIAFELEYYFKKAGANGHSFRPVISLGKESAIIHYDKNDQKLNSGNFLLVDVGNEFNHYCSDITRTLPIGPVSTRHEEVYIYVKEVQMQLIKEIKIGMTFREIEARTEKLIGEKLILLGLIKNPESKEIRKYYPHAVSHHLGLDVHDLADYRTPLKENMVITIEPGIYIKKEGIGVRIEDDVLITKNGAQVL